MLKSLLPGKYTVAFWNRSASTLNGDLFAETIVPTFCKAVLGSTYSAGPGPSLLAYKSCRCNKNREITSYSQFRKHYCSCSVTPTVSLHEAVNSFITTSSQPVHEDFVSANVKVTRWISWNYFQRRGFACELTVNNNRSFRFGYKGLLF